MVKNMNIKIGVLVFPGSNCVQETIDMFNYLNCKVTTIFHKESSLPKLDLYAIPGGFSYGDYIRTGMLASKSPVMNDLEKFSKEGRKIIGICNGFQILCERKILRGTLRQNINSSFICDNVAVKDVKINKTYTLPIAHGEGNYYYSDEQDPNIAFKYMDDINGSIDRIAGVYNERGNVLGMMPHPERAFKKYHCSQDGIQLIRSFFGNTYFKYA